MIGRINLLRMSKCVKSKAEAQVGYKTLSTVQIMRMLYSAEEMFLFQTNKKVDVQYSIAIRRFIECRQN